jgi:hypothetical protein
MWMIFARAPRPDAGHWPGRRVLAMIDAVAWPAALAVGLMQLPVRTGAIGQVLLAACLLAAVRRSWRAVFANGHYRFTSAGIAALLALLLAFGALLKIAT